MTDQAYRNFSDPKGGDLLESITVGVYRVEVRRVGPAIQVQFHLLTAGVWSPYAGPYPMASLEAASLFASELADLLRQNLDLPAP